MDAIESRMRITDALYRYCRAMDRIDAELGYSIWHEEGTAHYSGLYQGSGRGFVDWVCELHRGMIATSHQVTNVLIEVDGGSAASEAYVTVRLRVPTPDGGQADIVGAGRYLDRWSLRDGRWAIDHRDFVGDLTTTIPVPDPATAVGVRPAAEVAVIQVGRDDRKDPSYALLGR
jgi:hypothetical protein